MMENGRARSTHAIFTRAIGMPRSERDSMVAAACAGDPEMAAMVHRLLSMAERAGTFLETPALTPRIEHRQAVPDAIGNYLVIGVLGVGGMATVYEAVQENPHRRVALKVMHQHMTQSDAHLRFRLETETLARLHHPGIAQIYEAGTAMLGQPTPLPFFAMELVPDAVSINAYVKTRSPPLRERVAMVAAICDAVHHGHQHGVIHRDIKPANVLVDAEGRPKVIDFGVARVIERGVQSLTQVSAGGDRQLIGTLNYMSPEQCGAGDDIDIRTDVYSLGVVLYELVCGCLPLELCDLPLPAALHAIIHHPPRAPVGTHADRDLDAIMLKAIAKRPDHRYDSASALATDLRRWQNHLVTEARPASVVDQVRLFTRRHRGVVIAGASVVASIALAATLSTAFAIRLSQEVELRRTAEAQTTIERDQARWQAYTAQIAGALSAMNTGEFQQMRTRLAAAAHPRRGWEWGFLQRLAERSERVVLAHGGMIRDLACDPGWTHGATVAADGSLRLWRTDDLVTVATHQGAASTNTMAVSFVLDGRFVATGDDDGVVRLFRASDLAEADVIARMRTSVRSVAGLPGGRVAVAASDGSSFIWLIEGRTSQPFPQDQPGGIHGFAVSPDNMLLATFNGSGEIYVRRVTDLSIVQRLKFPAGVSQVRFSASADVVAAAGERGGVSIWRVADGELLRDIQVTNDVNTVRSIAISSDGTLLAAGLTRRGIVLCSVADGRVLEEIGGHTEAVSGLAFSPTGHFLISSSWDRSIRSWCTQASGPRNAGVTLRGHEHHVRGVAFSPDGSMLASVSRDGTLRLWDPALEEPIARLGLENVELSALAFSPDGRWIATAGMDRHLRFWDTATGHVTSLPSVDTSESTFSAVAFDNTGERIVAGDRDGVVHVTDVRGGAGKLVLKGHEMRVNAVRFSPDGKTIASGSRDRTVRVWDARSGLEIFCLRDHQLDVFDVLFSRDGRYLYSGSRDQTVRIWDLQTGTCVRILDGHGQYVTCMTLDATGARLAVGSWFGEIVLFDLHTFDLIASFRAHESAIRGIAFSPDGRWIASGSYDGTVRLLDSAPRAAADESQEQAKRSTDAARARLSDVLGPLALDPDDAMSKLAGVGLDPWADAWIRKALLSRLTSQKP